MISTSARTRAAIPFAFTLALAALAGACRPPDQAAGSPDADTASWLLADQPALHVGGQPAAGHELDRVFGGAMLDDGRIVVGNSGTGELRFFDRAGTLVHAAGRKGRGPGEFQAVSWVQPYRGDSLLAFDLRAQRFSVWTATGAFARIIQLPPGLPHSRAVGVFANGDILLAADHQPDPRGSEGVVRAEFDLVRIDAAGNAIATFGRFAGPEWLLYSRPGSFAATQPPFARTAYAAASGEYALYAQSDSNLVHLYDRGGRLVRTLHVPGEPRRLSAPETRDALDQIADRTEREALRRFTRDLAGASAPRIEDLRVDRNGNVWIRTGTAAPDASRWVVMALSGQPLGSILIPSGAMPLDITQDSVLLRETDGDGVQRVSLRGILR